MAISRITQISRIGRKGQIGVLILCCIGLLIIYGLQPNGEESPLQMSQQLTKETLKWYNYSQLEVRNMSGPHVKANDAWLIDLIRRRFLVAPPPKEAPYHLKEPHVADPSMGQSSKILTILKNMTNGFFVECGALDGETRSNTLFMERYLGWQGILIEADPINFQEMMKRGRHAWLSPTCLSLRQYPTIVSFEQLQNKGRISESAVPGTERPGFVDVQCLPLWSLLQALKRTRIDYFSLDVEGHELEVLKTIPFDKVDIRTLSVEFIHGKDGKEVLRNYMENLGYVVDSEVTHPNWLANDFIFKKEIES